MNMMTLRNTTYRTFVKLEKYNFSDGPERSVVMIALDSITAVEAVYEMCYVWTGGCRLPVHGTLEQVMDLIANASLKGDQS